MYPISVSISIECRVCMNSSRFFSLFLSSLPCFVPLFHVSCENRIPLSDDIITPCIYNMCTTCTNCSSWPFWTLFTSCTKRKHTIRTTTYRHDASSLSTIREEKKTFTILCEHRVFHKFPCCEDIRLPLMILFSCFPRRNCKKIKWRDLSFFYIHLYAFCEKITKILLVK